MLEYSDINIRGIGHPKYEVDRIIENDIVEVILQKLEVILFTNKGEVFGSEDMGCNLSYYLWQTNMSNDNLKEVVIEQINRYIPELNIMGYVFELSLKEGDYSDILFLNFIVDGYNVKYVFSE